jgi:hypothetical protein
MYSGLDSSLYIAEASLYRGRPKSTGKEGKMQFISYSLFFSEPVSFFRLSR